MKYTLSRMLLFIGSGVHSKIQECLLLNSNVARRESIKYDVTGPRSNSGPLNTTYLSRELHVTPCAIW